MTWQIMLRLSFHCCGPQPDGWKGINNRNRVSHGRGGNNRTKSIKRIHCNSTQRRKIHGNGIIATSFDPFSIQKTHPLLSGLILKPRPSSRFT